MTSPLFELGRVMSTPGALAAFEKSGEVPDTFLDRHVAGDWGALGEHDKHANAAALTDGDRLLSKYHLRDGTAFYIITEHDRSLTTILLPEEY